MKVSFSYLARGLIVLSCVMASSLASAQNFPNKPLRLIVTSAPGGVTDVLGRTVADKLSAVLGQAVVVENVPGGNTMIGASRALRGDADGYTMFMASSSTLSLNPATRKKLPYDAEKDFDPVVFLATNEYVVVSRPSLGVKDVAELVDLARKKPGSIKYGMSVGAPNHFGPLMLEKAAGIELMGVPYKDATQATSGLLTGEIDIVFAPYPTVEHLIGQKVGVSMLGVANKDRMPQIPDVTTVEEQGFKDVWALSWYGIVLKAGAPKEAIDTLNKAINDVLKDEAVRERLFRAGFNVYGGTIDEFVEYMKKEAPVYQKIAQDANISID
ncbi:MAG: tripartite tricarboxylate transporter substrate binding protein [Pigmentiphaga sp.]|nr:tripartite tricarboxylate transporter substrate binding protein [Pigmentiphaga sp.]